MLRRGLIVAAVLLAASVMLSGRERGSTPLARPLTALPWQLDEWQGARVPELSADLLAAAGADEHTQRVYRDRVGTIVGLYIAYYGSQRQGDTMHSPLNCLPGSGWEPGARARLPIDELLRNGKAARAAGASSRPDAEVNRILLTKGDEQQLVFYWYQGRGRVVASEYWGKVYTVLDALQRRRTDGALVRVNLPVARGSEQAERAADLRLTSFVSLLLPLLDEYLTK